MPYIRQVSDFSSNMCFKNNANLRMNHWAESVWESGVGLINLSWLCSSAHYSFFFFFYALLKLHKSVTISQACLCNTCCTVCCKHSWFYTARLLLNEVQTVIIPASLFFFFFCVCMFVFLWFISVSHGGSLRDSIITYISTAQLAVGCWWPSGIHF